MPLSLAPRFTVRGIAVGGTAVSVRRSWSSYAPLVITPRRLTRVTATIGVVGVVSRQGTVPSDLYQAASWVVEVIKRGALPLRWSRLFCEMRAPWSRVYVSVNRVCTVDWRGGLVEFAEAVVAEVSLVRCPETYRLAVHCSAVGVSKARPPAWVTDCRHRS